MKDIDIAMIAELQKEIAKLEKDAYGLLGRANYSRYMADYHREISRTSMRQYKALMNEISFLKCRINGGCDDKDG